MFRLVLLQSLLVSAPGLLTDFSSKSEDYEFGDYRGKWCLDDQGFVYSIGEVYLPSPSSCPCTCTADGPVCTRPRCPRVHPRCTRLRYKGCCPVCQSMARVCVYQGQTYRLLQEFWVSRCERCRCGANREVYCTISDCPAPHCVDPTYEPNHCCPICRSGPNCFAGNRIIPAGERVRIDDSTVCYCTYREGTWFTHPHATCEEERQPEEEPEEPPSTDSPPDPDPREAQDEGRGSEPRLERIP